MKSAAFFQILLLISGLANASERSNANFKTSCKALLRTNGETITVTAESEVFPDTIGGYGQSVTKLQLGPYTLISAVSMSQPFGSPSMEPTFEMNLFNGNPMQGQLNEVRVQGLELGCRAVDQPLSLYGMNFLQFVYNGKNVSRIDYSCAVIKLR